MGRNVAYLQKDAQPRGGFGGGLYGGRGGQIMWRVGSQNFRERMQNNQGEQRLGRDPNAMDVDRGKGGIGHAMCVENGAIWPKTVGRGRKEKKE